MASGERGITLIEKITVSARGDGTPQLRGPGGRDRGTAVRDEVAYCDGAADGSGSIGWVVPALPMDKPNRVSDSVVQISKVHLITGFIEAHGESDRYPRTRRQYPLVTALHVLEVMRDDVHQLEFNRLVAPNLPPVRGPLPCFLGYPVNRMIDRYRGQERETYRVPLRVKFIKRRINDQLKVSRQRVHGEPVSVPSVG